jgi:hypothetical protein
MVFNIRAEIVRQNCNVSEVARRLQANGKKITPEGLNNKIRLGRVRISELEEILSVIGLELRTIEKNLRNCG